MNMSRDQLSAKQQMIVVCEGMLQLLEPAELAQVMEDISRRVRERLSPESVVTDTEVVEDKGKKNTRGREMWLRGVKYTSVAEACKKHGILDDKAIGTARKDLRNGVSPEDIFPPLEQIKKVSMTTDHSGNVMTEADKVAMGG